uniref:C-type lectin domain-containing protein n=1 Tax=Ornithorhynchus anatinus TaxID=9258 RepID=A0A6I8P5I2_ORNAN
MAEQIGSSGVGDISEQGTHRGRHFSDNLDGPLLVPVPCAVLVVVIITTLTLSIITLSVGKYNCPGIWENQEPGKNVKCPASPISCPDDWIGFRGKCYLLSNIPDTWNASKRFCSNLNATLTKVESEKDLLLSLPKRHDQWTKRLPRKFIRDMQHILHTLNRRSSEGNLLGPQQTTSVGASLTLDILFQDLVGLGTQSGLQEKKKGKRFAFPTKLSLPDSGLSAGM